jgi:hypothetical protein
MPAAHRIYPLLDPLLPSRQPAIARLWIGIYKRLLREPGSRNRVLRSFAGHHADSPESLHSVFDYFRDADAYLDSLLRLLPEAEADRLRPLPETRRENDLGQLLCTMFEDGDSRRRYEAQRKLQLGKILFDVDHSRSVRDGPRHRARFEAILQRSLWSNLVDDREVEVCCRLSADESGVDRLEVGVPASGHARCWRFNVRRLPAHGGEPEIEVYHYRTRFKREYEALNSSTTGPGPPAATEPPPWPGLTRRSGSILSKMIRQGIGDPSLVQDLLGAMFIVRDRKQAYALERRITDPLGGPFRWRDRVDTLADERQREWLNPRSANGFQVLKKIVDILIEDPSAPSPYLFSVEIQIFPLEAYLRTRYDEHFASHMAYKKRQFLHDLLPLLFPVEVYGRLGKGRVT